MTKYAVDDASTHSFLQPESLFPRHREYGPLHLVDILVRTVPGIFFEDLSLSLWDSDPMRISWLRHLKFKQCWMKNLWQITCLKLKYRSFYTIIRHLNVRAVVCYRRSSQGAKACRYGLQATALQQTCRCAFESDGRNQTRCLNSLLQQTISWELLRK